MARPVESGPPLTEESLRERWIRLVDRVGARLDRFKFARERARARARLLREGRPQEILVVCTGNICRSPYAEAVLRSILAEHGMKDIQVESAGFIGPDRPAEPRGLALAGQRGFDLGSHRSRLVSIDDSSRFDLFLVMTRRHRKELVRRFRVDPDRIILLGDFDPDGGPEREIADPFGQEDEVFTRSFDQIDRSIRGLCQTLARAGE